MPLSYCKALGLEVSSLWSTKICSLNLYPPPISALHPLGGHTTLQTCLSLKPPWLPSPMEEQSLVKAVESVPK